MVNITGFKILRACKCSRKHRFSEHFNIMSVLGCNMLENEHIHYLARQSLSDFDSLRLYWNDLEGATSCNWNSTKNYRWIGVISHSPANSV
jgi:hypothetical protein